MKNNTLYYVKKRSVAQSVIPTEDSINIDAMDGKSDEEAAEVPPPPPEEEEAEDPAQTPNVGENPATVLDSGVYGCRRY